CALPERIFAAFIPQTAFQSNDLSILDEQLEGARKGSLVGTAETRQSLIRKIERPAPRIHFHEEDRVYPDLVRTHAAHAADEVVLIPFYVWQDVSRKVGNVVWAHTLEIPMTSAN